MKRLLLTVALLLVVAVASAQVTTSSVRGVVTTNDKQPIAGAAVVARHEPSGSLYGVCTNADGHYAINGMRVGGPYTIEFSYLGYKTQQHIVTETHVGETIYIDATLNEDYEVIDEVIVVVSTNDTRTFSREWWSRWHRTCGSEHTLQRLHHRWHILGRYLWPRHYRHDGLTHTRQPYTY